MELSARRLSWRLVLVPLIVATLVFGWLAFARHTQSTAPRPLGATPTKLTASDLLLAAAKAKAGIFLQYDSVTGPASADHTNHAPVGSFQLGIERGISSPAGGGRVVSKPNMSEASITHRSDKYSAPLMQESLTGAGHNAVIYFTNLAVKGAPVDYLEFDLENVLISGFQLSSGGDVPSESISLNFTKMTMKAQLGGTPGSVQTVTFTLVTPGP